MGLGAKIRGWALQLSVAGPGPGWAAVWVGACGAVRAGLAGAGRGVTQLWDLRLRCPGPGSLEPLGLARPTAALAVAVTEVLPRLRAVQAGGARMPSWSQRPGGGFLGPQCSPLCQQPGRWGAGEEAEGMIQEGPQEAN